MAHRIRAVHDAHGGVEFLIDRASDRSKHSEEIVDEAKRSRRSHSIGFAREIMHKRSKSCEPSSEMDERRRRGGFGGNGATTCDDSACGARAAASSASSSSSSATTSHCSSVSVYRAKINGAPRHVTAVWHRTLINQSFTISIDGGGGGGAGAGDDGALSHKVELKPWPFWSKRGAKTLDVDGDRLDIVWDLRSAKFPASSPEPAAGYYVALVSRDEVVLLLGDGKKDAFKRTRSRPSLDDAVLVSRRESVSGRRTFAARAPLAAGRKDHEIVVDSAIAGPREPEMRITVDGVVLVLWDVHDWIFAGGPAAQAVFVFKPGAPPPGGDRCGRRGGAGAGGIGDEGGYSFFLQAWKTE
ncbi:hypothetical protein OsJ_05776 [Oryza sativa Japonica Group]|uniref:Uncharacterized protein n=1 Tax=Oryza sativa subsp. japonica TaxID=39947 RepID=B9F3V4_ORYSJ|nr:hypothetical protein OsJ_05776 [Oryza sativa Japonica Group]